MDGQGGNEMSKELKAIKQGSVELGEYWVYDADDVDVLIAEKDKEITELKNLVKLAEEERDYYKNIRSAKHEAELESLKASHYAEMVDAGMRERRLNRALWLARANDAKHLVTVFENYDYLDFYKLNIKQESARTLMTCKLRTPAEWVNIWKEVERKCRAKAEEYR
jgi:hypothetical protein